MWQKINIILENQQPRIAHLEEKEKMIEGLNNWKKYFYEAS